MLSAKDAKKEKETSRKLFHGSRVAACKQHTGQIQTTFFLLLIFASFASFADNRSP